MGFTQKLVDILENLRPLDHESLLNLKNRSPKKMAEIEEKEIMTKQVVKTLASLSNQCDPAREMIILKLKGSILNNVLTVDSSFELLHSLSRAGKMFKNMLLEEP